MSTTTNAVYKAQAQVGPGLGVKFVSAGLAACTADIATFPLDLAKVRLQLQGEFPLPAPAGTGSMPKLRPAPLVAALAEKHLVPKALAIESTGVPKTAGISMSSLLKPKQIANQVNGVRSAATLAMEPATIAEGVAKEVAKPKYRGLFGTMRTIAMEEGFRGLYGGIVPGLHRQLVFASIRVGMYDGVKDFYQGVFSNDHQKSVNGITPPPSTPIRMLAGLTTGAVAISVAQPTDVVKVRMQAQRMGGGTVRYTSSLIAYKMIAKTEGIRGLWKGLAPNVARNSVMNCSELVSYDMIKEYLIKSELMNDALPCHFASGLGAGFITTCVGSPIDVVKTRFMNSQPNQYTGVADCAKKIYIEGGAGAFYKGFGPAFMRLSSWNICMFICFEQYKKHISRVTRIEPTPEQMYEAQHSKFQRKHRKEV